MKSKKRNIYLDKKPLDEALGLFFSRLDFENLITEEEIETTDSLNRVTSRPVFAKISSPNCHGSAMDGIAVSAVDTYGASEANPKRLEVGSQALFINTGNRLPEDKDAVIMIEDIHEVDSETVEIVRAALPNQHVRAMGEDIVATEFLLPKAHIIRPFDIGALLGAGHTMVMVKKMPGILLIPTGDELAEPSLTKVLKPGEVYESNSAVIGAMSILDGASYERHDIVSDVFDDIKRAVEENIASFDVVIVLAGSSAGSRDYTRAVIEELGEVLVHGISIMPGKPTILGIIEKKPVIGLPGYPVSAVMTYRSVVRPMIAKMLGLGEPVDDGVTVTVLRDIPSKVGNDEFLRVRIAEVDGTMVASPLPRGAGNITTMVKADGIVRIDALSEGLKRGDKTISSLLRRRTDIINTIMVIGSHDISLDLLAGELKLLYPEYSLASVNVGSLGGIMALRNGECHLAGSHLLDPETGLYNIPAIKRYLGLEPMVLVTLAYRQQGLIVDSGNPSGIKGISDLTRDDVVFVNRQRGSGTRLLLDYQLKKKGIDLSQINGYEKEEFTHMNVAATVSVGRATCGLGIKAAAQALELDFIPVDEERYDLIIPLRFWETERISALIEILKKRDFQEKILALGGYDTRDTGKYEIIGK